MAIALQPYTIRHEVFNREQAESACKRISEMGFDGLEYGLGYGKGFTAEEERLMYERYGLRICDVYADLEKPESAMALADMYGTKYISAPGMTEQMMMSPEGFEAFAGLLNETAKPYAAAGYKLMYHNHNQEFRNFASLGGKPGLDILIENTDPNGIYFLFDVFWASAAGADPAFWLRRLHGRVRIVHFKDFAIDDQISGSIGSAIPFRFAEIGRGNINWPEVTAACRESGVEWYSVEQDHTRGGAFESARISLEYMRSKLNIK